MSKLVFIGDLEPLMEQIGGARRKQYERLLTEAARYETMELPAVHPKKSSTYMGIAIVNLALAYRLSKDEKYLTHAKRFMNTVLSYEKWGNAHLVNVDLSASWILFGLSLGYDWLKPYLSEDERKRIAAKLKHHARIIYEYRKETYGKDWSTNYYQNHNWINMNGLATTLIIMIIMRIGNMLSIGYERVLLMYNSNVYVTADVLSTFEQRIGILSANYGMGASVSLFNSLIAFALVIGANSISRNISDTSLW